MYTSYIRAPLTNWNNFNPLFNAVITPNKYSKLNFAHS